MRQYQFIQVDVFTDEPFGGNPLACAASLASIKVIQKEKLAENAGKLGGKMMEELKQANAVEVRGKGLLIGVQIEGDARKACEALIQEGVLASCPTEGVVRLTPPLTLNEEEAGEAVKAVKKVVGEKQ